MSYHYGNVLDSAFAMLRQCAYGERGQLEAVEADALLSHVAAIMDGRPEEPDLELMQFLTVQRLEEWLNAYTGVESKASRRGRRYRRTRQPGR